MRSLDRFARVVSDCCYPVLVRLLGLEGPRSKLGKISLRCLGEWAF